MGNSTSAEHSAPSEQTQPQQVVDDYEIVYQKTYLTAVTNDYHEKYNHTGDINMPAELIDARYLSAIFDRLVAHKDIDYCLPTIDGRHYVIPNNQDFERLITRATSYTEDSYHAPKQTTMSYFIKNYWLPFLFAVLKAHGNSCATDYKGYHVISVELQYTFLPAKFTPDLDDYIIETGTFRITPAARNPVNSTAVMCCQRGPNNLDQ